VSRASRAARRRVWREQYGVVCRAHSDLVAIFESNNRPLALLLRHTLVPLPEEQKIWLADTRRAARAVIGSLRSAGLRGPVLVLQWRSLDEVAHVLRAWRCRFVADDARRDEIARVVFRLLDDRRFISTKRAAAPVPDLVGLSRGLPVPRRSLSGWYRLMTPTWCTAEPPIRRQLILRTHRWIVERVVRPLSRGADPWVADRRLGGGLAPDSLAQALARSLPPAEANAWRRWIELTVTDLDRALARPGRPCTSGWLRWLFLIPYSVPVGPGSPRPARVGAAPAAGADDDSNSETMNIRRAVGALIRAATDERATPRGGKDTCRAHRSVSY
jgi:hypothetical protein